MNAIFKYIRKNWFELLVTLFIFTNLFPHWFPQWMYYLSFVMILYKMNKFHPLGTTPKTSLFVGFVICLWISTIIGMALDLRLVIFSLIIFISMPRKSINWHNYKIKLLYNIFIGFGIATIANLYAKQNGINLIRVDEYMLKMGRVAEFSGFASYAMWTGCSAALSAVFFTSIAFRKIGKGVVARIFSYAMILVSLYITMISGSRSAFFLSLVCIVLIIALQTGKIAKFLKVAFVLGITAIFFVPFLEDNSQAMMQKKNGLEITVEETSRDALWAQRIAEFKSSPIFGIGFAAHGVGDAKRVGRNESGGSYISVLAQAGIVGVIFIALIWAAAFMLPKKIGKDPDVILLYAGFVFFCFHSIVEGYMFQAGWYLCLIIWMIIGVMIEHKLYGRQC